MQTDHDKDNDTPKFDFSKAQLARHRVRAGLETPEQYEERRALANRAIAAGGLAVAASRHHTAETDIGFQARLALRVAEGTAELARRLAHDVTRSQSASESALTREEFDEELHVVELLLETAQAALARLRRRRPEVPSNATPGSGEARS